MSGQNAGRVLQVADPDAKTLDDTPLAKYFRAAVKLQGSDLIMRGGEVPKLRLRGALRKMDTPAPSIRDFNAWVEEGLTPGQVEDLHQYGSADIGCNFTVGAESHRFRVNVFYTRGRCAIAARRVSNEILNFDQLYLPPSTAQVCSERQGIVLLCGVTGSGKSTTIAAMLQKINEERQCHILTIEDPIEYLFTDSVAMINQREIGIDVPNFATALRAMVRENPDVVLVGEMRDRETFEAALQAAETGHLVFGTIHGFECHSGLCAYLRLVPRRRARSGAQSAGVSNARVYLPEIAAST